MKTVCLIVAAVLLLAGCGQREALKPADGHAMPPRPMMAPSEPTVPELLKPPVESRPGRSDDALTKSQERPDDRFNLPPPG